MTIFVRLEFFASLCTDENVGLRWHFPRRAYFISYEVIDNAKLLKLKFARTFQTL